MMDRLNGLYLQAWAALRDRLEREDGQAVVEYGLILALIVVGVVVTLKAIGTDIGTMFDNVKCQLESNCASTP